VLALAFAVSVHALAGVPGGGPGARVVNSVHSSLASSGPRARAPRLVTAGGARLPVPGATLPRPLDSPRGAPDASTANASTSGWPAAAAYRRELPATLPWRNEPEWVRTIRGYRSGGVPVVHLWQGSHALVAIGVNRRGVPGIYLTQKIGD
jgi:hypothetical protein